MPVRRVAFVALAAVALAAAALVAVVRSSDEDTVPNAASPTATRLAPGFQYTDCSKIQAGEKLDRSALELLCEPANRARLETLDCTSGIYVHLRRPVGDLEGIVGRTDWRKAGDVDAETGRTPFAFTECTEGDF